MFSAFYALGVGLFPFLFAFLVRVKNRSIAEHMIFNTDIMIWIICLMQYVFLRGAEIRMLLSGVLIHFVLLCVWYLRHDAITETAYDSSSSGFQHFQMPVRLWFRAFVSVVVALYAMCFAVKTNWTIDKSLTDELYQNGLDYGFATYWNANFYTVHSSNQVKIRPVVIEKNRVKSTDYQSEQEWYRKEQIGDKDWFILLSGEEYRLLSESDGEQLLTTCKTVFEITGYYVLVYSADQYETVLLR